MQRAQGKDNKTIKTIKKMVGDLIKRREQQEYRIKKLLDPTLNHNYDTNNSIDHDESMFSEMLKKLNTSQPQYVQENISSFGNHVNLLATVTLKTEVHLQEKCKIREVGRLQQSLLEKFGQRQVVIKFEGLGKSAQGWVKQLTQYILQQQIHEGLITQQQTSKNHYDYYTTYFNNGIYEQICLSQQELLQQESQLILLDNANTINISLLLIKRLFRNHSHINLPSTLHTLFSFPFKTFLVQSSKQLLLFNEYLGLLGGGKGQGGQREKDNNLHVYGIDRFNNQSFSIANLTKTKNLETFQEIIEQFNSIIIIDETERQVKSLTLCCIYNHFVIVTLKVKTEGYYYLSLGSANHHKQYNLILLDEECNHLHSEIINNREFCYVYLKVEDYQLYIYPFGECLQVKQDESFQLVKQGQQNFSLWIQGKHIFTKKGQLQLQVRLKQKYNAYTSQIALQYLANNKQQMDSQLLLDNYNEQILIKRYILTKLNLVLDTFVLRVQEKATVHYQGYHLCDNLFQENMAVISNGCNIVLYRQNAIERVAVDTSQQNLSYRILRFYI